VDRNATVEIAATLGRFMNEQMPLSRLLSDGLPRTGNFEPLRRTTMIFQLHESTSRQKDGAPYHNTTMEINPKLRRLS